MRICGDASLPMLGLRAPRFETPTVRQRDVIIVGGGPSGSTLAALLARAGLEVTVLEREAFPRYHNGESLVPEVLDVLQESGALPAVESAAPENYFWKAYAMLPSAADPQDAFIRLVSGRLGV